uniref:Uncharacterized protein n=1 Tax=Rhizophora mucronata TaxID=61149 RepID=A0A2P2P3N2_RHIMU
MFVGGIDERRGCVCDERG